ncbi:MAG: cell division protein ZapE [Nitriliruptorales bacterium]|nr:cell division protein ZapE [Nitriliruptorales bacterium]
MTAAPTVSPELRQVLRRLKLGKMLDTLPERLTLAKQSKLGHAAFLELVLADEIDRRDRSGAAQRARSAGLDPTMTLEAWDDHDAITYDHDILAELATLRFVEDHHCAFILGPVGVGKTHLAHALGHIACRRRRRVHAERADRLFKRLKASRLDNSHDQELRRLIAVDLLIIDDFALHGLDATATGDFYEIAVERHLTGATLLTSNREPIEWLTQLADPLLAQSAIDRLQSSAYELVIEGESYRRRQKPTITANTTTRKDR